MSRVNPALREALAGALDEAEHDRGVNAVLFRAEGPAFCAGYQLDWATSGQAENEAAGGRVWDSVADLQGIGQYASTWAKLHSISKPTISYHIKVLFHAGLIEVRKQGRHYFYILRRETLDGVLAEIADQVSISLNTSSAPALVSAAGA